ncbi:MAG: hypothetical protein HW382_1072 [Deltaproteobacteria bacterium]|nr:hypothetical protein [Deltaproteobacteria bacterium]
MPTRTKPQRRRTRSRTGVSITPPISPQLQQETTSSSTSRKILQSKPKATEPDYSYVYRDLKHTAIIVGGILAIYIILRFTLLS